MSKVLSIVSWIFRRFQPVGRCIVRKQKRIILVFIGGVRCIIGGVSTYADFTLSICFLPLSMNMPIMPSETRSKAWVCLMNHFFQMDLPIEYSKKATALLSREQSPSRNMWKREIEDICMIFPMLLFFFEMRIFLSVNNILKSRREIFCC